MKKLCIIILVFIMSITVTACKNSEQENNLYKEEIAGLKYSSIEDLISDFEDNNYQVGNNEAIYDLETYFDGYELCSIEVMPNFIANYYMPIGYDEVKGYLSTEGIIFQYSREGVYDETTVLSSYAKQYNLDYTSDGYIYRPDINKIVFSVGARQMDIIVPDSLNDYDFLKEYCLVKEITVNTQSGDGLETE